MRRKVPDISHSPYKHLKEVYLPRQRIASGNDDEVETIEGANLSNSKVHETIHRILIIGFETSTYIGVCEVSFWVP